jgi:FKBP-type peptidyl-prolyl cis-trans isomerase
MIRLSIAILIVMFALNDSFAQNRAVNTTNVPLNTFQDSVAYAIGMQIGGNLKMDSLMLDLDVVKQGMYDALYTNYPKLDDAQMGQIMQRFQQELIAKQQAKAEAAGAENLKKAEDFLAQNKSKDGIKVTESGLQYEVITEGTGKSPVSTDTVEVHYEGTLLDGTVFDSSYERGETIEFPLDRVISGWTEGVQLMKEGAVYKFYIHPDMGYGSRGAGQNIGPNELLIFKVELIKVK